MANCALTSDYTLDSCKGGIAGLANVYFIEKGNVSAFTKASGVITALTKVTGKKFRKYELQKHTALFEEEINASVDTGGIGYKQTLTIVLNRNDTALRNEILLLAKNLLLAVVQFKNGTYWLAGEEGGLDLSGGKRGSGTQANDRNGYDLTFEGEEAELAPEVAEAVYSVLTTAG